jgi:hypothetical protein
MIYVLALGSETLYFDYQNVIMAAALRHDVLEPAWGKQCDLFGLHAWMYSSKQIKMEALDVISRTFTFTVIGPSESRGLGIEPPVYQDVFKNGLIRNILIRTKLHISVMSDPVDSSLRMGLLDTSGITTGEFLLIAKELGTEDIALDMWWIRFDILEGSEWHQDELPLYQGPWDEGWNGRFHRVKITVTVENNPRFDWEDETPEMTKHIEDFAKRLVGQNAEVVHFALPRAVIRARSWLRRGLIA